MYTIAQIEDAIIARLKSQIPYLLECASLGEFLLREIEENTLRYPAAYVAYQRGDYEYRVSGAQDRRMNFVVVLVVRNERGDEAARHGQGAEVGVYKLLDDARTALTYQSCGLNIDPLLPQTEQAIDGTDTVSIYALNVSTRCRQTF